MCRLGSSAGFGAGLRGGVDAWGVDVGSKKGIGFLVCISLSTVVVSLLTVGDTGEGGEGFQGKLMFV